jgi:hypothetical protein
MFEEIIREIEKLNRPRPVHFSVPLDKKRFFDRQCPSAECGGVFKVHFDDWEKKVTDKGVFCPFCRHEAKSDRWHTPEQAEYIQSVAMAEMTRMVQGALQRGVERSRPTAMDAGLFQVGMSLSYSPGHVPAVVPVTATDALRQDFTSEECGCRYASLGASFFCPACGHNSATSSFDNTLETVRKTVGALETVRDTLEQTTNADTARDAVRQLLEDQFPRLVGAFERLNEALFDKLPNVALHPKKGTFQRMDEASQLWLQASGKGYGDFLSGGELQRMKLWFQRRHVFSHRQGLIDQGYIDKSGDNSYAVGQRLVVREADVLELVDLMEKLAAGLRTVR